MIQRVLLYFQEYMAEFLAPPDCRGTRDAVAFFSLFAGGIRIFEAVGTAGRLAQPVSILPSALYGVLLVLAGVMLLLTGADCQRASPRGQAAAALAAGLWLLLALDVLGRSLASGVNAVIIAALAVNEVRVHDC